MPLKGSRFLPLNPNFSLSLHQSIDLCCLLKRELSADIAAATETELYAICVLERALPFYLSISLLLFFVFNARSASLSLSLSFSLAVEGRTTTATNVIINYYHIFGL